MSEKKPLLNERIRIIEDALKHTSAENTGAAYYYILWGCCLFLFFLLQFLGRSNPSQPVAQAVSLSWMVFPLGGLLSYLHNRKDKKEEKIVPLYERFYTFVWGGVGLALGAVSACSLFKFPEFYIITTALLFGLASFITGGVTKFRPSVIGGAICIVCAAIAIDLPIDIKCLAGAAGMLSACIVPGVLMKKSQTSNV